MLFTNGRRFALQGIGFRRPALEAQDLGQQSRAVGDVGMGGGPGRAVKLQGLPRLCLRFLEPVSVHVQLGQMRLDPADRLRARLAGALEELEGAAIEAFRLLVMTEPGTQDAELSHRVRDVRMFRLEALLEDRERLLEQRDAFLAPPLQAAQSSESHRSFGG